LEERAGVSKRTISEIERGVRTPHTLTLAKLANALEVDLDELLEDEAPKVEAPPSPELPKEGDAGAAALTAWSEYLDALLRRAEELREMFLALGDLDDLDPEDAEHRIDMTFAVALEFALNVDRITDAQKRGLLTHAEGTGLTPKEMQQLVLVFRRSNELIRRRNSLVTIIDAVRNLAEDMAIKKAVKDLLEDAGIPDWEAVPKDV
ncbi:MAG: helix-turn-helix transcriptional regulator, partial [Actinomycetota bacterium]|nr:helix-turn-helix transcriptional regulator [Actinomycetota bacterium]